MLNRYEMFTLIFQTVFTLICSVEPEQLVFIEMELILRLFPVSLVMHNLRQQGFMLLLLSR